MNRKLTETLKNIGLLTIFCFFIFLIFALPKDRGFETESSIKKSFTNLGSIFRIGLSSRSPLFVDEDGWTNVLVLGRPGAGNPAPDLTDTIILVSFKDEKASFLSIPRDFYVAPDSSGYRKINSLYAVGYKLNEIGEVISKITGKTVHYEVIVELELLRKITEYLGGVNVYVQEDISDPLFPGPHFSYSPFEIKKGWRHLDSETLLKYIRTRHDSEGDFGRMKRQQQVLAAMKNKIENLNQLQNFNLMIGLYDDFKEHIDTDLSLKEMRSFWGKLKNLDISSSKAHSLTIKNPLLLKESYVMTTSGRMFVLWPTAGLYNYTQIHSYVKNIYETF